MRALQAAENTAVDIDGADAPTSPVDLRSSDYFIRAGARPLPGATRPEPAGGTSAGRLVDRGRSVPGDASGRSAWATILLVTALASLLVAAAHGAGEALADLLPAGGADRPTPQEAPGNGPLGTAPPVPAEAGPHRFLALQPDGSGPVAYDPCRPLRYVVNDRTAPPGAEALLGDALRQVQQASGLQLVDDGASDEVPADDRPAFSPERYGDRWAPILIAWSDPLEIPALDGRVAGTGGSTSVGPPAGPHVYVTGQVVLDGPQLATRLSQHGSAHVRAVIVHELGHLLGLDHVDDPGQLLHPRSAQTALQPGDLTGLARLGAGACVPRL